MGHYDKAITAYDSALRIHPDDKLVQENREKALNALKKK
jgi:tetratricopeptide (TPR) repeat protein